MALPSYSFASLKAAAEHAMVRSAASGSSAGDCVNDALAFLVCAHPWTWRARPLSLDSVAGQSYIELPEDLGQIDGKLAGPNLTVVEPASLEQIALWRRWGTPFSDMIRYAPSARPQETASSLPRRVLELYPTPSASVVGYLTGHYLRLVPALADDSDVPDIPAAFHPLLKTLCRAFAVSDEEQQAGEDWAKAQRLLPAMIREDGLLRGPLGALPAVTGFGLRSSGRPSPGGFGPTYTLD